MGKLGMGRGERGRGKGEGLMSEQDFCLIVWFLETVKKKRIFRGIIC